MGTSMEFSDSQRLKCLLLISTILFSCCGAVVHKQDNYEVEYVKSRDDCALMLRRSHSPRITDVYSKSSHHHESDHGHHHESDHDGMEECIRYQDINEALRVARRRLQFRAPDTNAEELRPEEIEMIANVLIETSRRLAQKFQLSFKEINHGLPTIDTSKTDIWSICPDIYKPTTCRVRRFRNINGRCTNLQNSVDGMAGTPFKRLLPPVYSNGIDAPKVSPIDGKPLPHPRVVSVNVHTDISQLDRSVAIHLMSWAQIIDHDILRAQTITNATGGFLNCCPGDVHPSCRPIDIPKNDPYYAKFGETCMSFQRNIAAIRPNCALGPRLQTNFVTSTIDGNFIYGNLESELERLRLGKKGLLKTWPKFHDQGLKDLLPPNTGEDQDNFCLRVFGRSKYCFLCGDLRANFQIQTAVLQTIYVREHNRIAMQLAHLNPHWKDERTFQETKHLMAAVIQRIIYNEFLPVLLGPDYMHMYNLTLLKQGYWNGYEKDVSVSTSTALQTAAFRFGHTLLNQKMAMYDKNHKFLDALDVHDVISQPFDLYGPGVIDKIMNGFLNSPMENFDPFLTTEVSKHLFQPPNSTFGQDLATLNTNRGRDNAIPGYNEYREWCGLPRAKTFEDLEPYLKNGTVFKFSLIYRHPDEIDLWTGSLSERRLKGGVLGPTFACIIAYQMSLIRKGDPFWHENPGFPSSFTPGQLQEIRQMTQAKVLCENADDLPTIQRWTMLLPDPKRNPRVHCKDIPTMNLKYWMEDPATKQFMHQN